MTIGGLFLRTRGRGTRRGLLANAEHGRAGFKATDAGPTWTAFPASRLWDGHFPGDRSTKPTRATPLIVSYNLLMKILLVLSKSWVAGRFTTSNATPCQDAAPSVQGGEEELSMKVCIKCQMHLVPPLFAVRGKPQLDLGSELDLSIDLNIEQRINMGSFSFQWLAEEGL